MFEEIASRSDFSFETLEVDQDHMHGLVKSEPHLSPLSVVRRLKQESTIRLWETMNTHYRDSFGRNGPIARDGYFCCPIGNASQATIRQSIEQQG